MYSMYLNALKTLHTMHLLMHLQTLHYGGIIQKILVTQWLVQLAVRSSVQPLPRFRSSVHSVEGTNLNCFTACSCYSHCCSNSTGLFLLFFYSAHQACMNHVQFWLQLVAYWRRQTTKTLLFFSFFYWRRRGSALLLLLTQVQTEVSREVGLEF